MSDEIKKAQKIALDLQIHEIIKNIVTKAGAMPSATKAEWEGCQLEVATGTGALSITMPNGTVLYKAINYLLIGNARGVEISDFRYGTWVEKLKAYSEQITAEKRRAEAEKQSKKRGSN